MARSHTWHATRWLMDHPEVALIELTLVGHRTKGTEYRLNMQQGENSASIPITATSEREAKQRAEDEVRTFVDVLKGRISWVQRLGWRR